MFLVWKFFEDALCLLLTLQVCFCSRNTYDLTRVCFSMFQGFSVFLGGFYFFGSILNQPGIRD